ncbi:STAS domain-containing protein [Nonomuraea sp. NPDC050404]|uniref:STAS domain-containing protein n=1 Tax=Nonomuraea sp. NPDC050404 TaxID=3155783 RepID=UPI003405600F
MMQLSVRLVPVSAETLVIALTGELDSTTRPVLAAFLDPLPQASVKYVLVAAGDLWFCDLNGLELLSITHRALQAKGGHLALAEVQPPLRRLIALMHEHSLAAIPVFDSMPEALADAGVDSYRSAPTVVGRRHLPRLRTMPRLPSTARDGSRPRPEPVRPVLDQPVLDQPVLDQPVLDQPVLDQPEPGRPEPEPAARETGREISASPPPPIFEMSNLNPIIHEARALRERATRQQETMARQLALTSESSTLLATARERCGAALRIMRLSLTDVRLTVGADSRSPAPPRFR